jgi:anthranilate synthase component 1
MPPMVQHDKVVLLPDVSDKEYIDKVIRAKEYIRQGDIFQVVLSRTFIGESDLPPFALYRALRKLNPTPYLYLFEEADFAVVGASPELLVGVKDEVKKAMISTNYSMIQKKLLNTLC